MENLGSATSGRFFGSADSKLYRSPSYFGVFLGLLWRRKRDERASFAVARNDSFSTNAYSCPQKNISLTKPSTFFVSSGQKRLSIMTFGERFTKFKSHSSGWARTRDFEKNMQKELYGLLTFLQRPISPLCAQCGCTPFRKQTWNHHPSFFWSKFLFGFASQFSWLFDLNCRFMDCALHLHIPVDLQNFVPGAQDLRQTIKMSSERRINVAPSNHSGSSCFLVMFV